MKAYTNSKQVTGRSSSACGYCRQVGHSIRECPHIEYDYNEWNAFRVPHQSPTLQHNRWLRNDYSYWVKQVNKYYPKWKAAQQTTTNSSGRVVRARKCGFCGSTAHTRRQCTSMTAMYDKLVKANINYRQALYDKVVANLGIGLGAVLKVQQSGGYNRAPQEFLATVVGFDLGDINVFRTTNSYELDSDYRGTMRITVRANGQEYSLDLAEMLLAKPDGRLTKWAERYYSGWNSLSFVETIARSTQPLDQEWVTSGADSFQWLVKKKSYDWLNKRKMIETINEWGV